MVNARVVVAVMSLMLCQSVFAAKAPVFDDGSSKIDFDPSLVEQWKEAEVAVPAYPRETDLIAIRMAPADTLKLYIDSNSLSRAADRVLRLTLVVESSSGTRNVFFDGLRCETRQYKTYATAAPDGKFVSVKNPQWQDIPRPSRNAFRFYLIKHYVCDDASSARSPRDFLDQLK